MAVTERLTCELCYVQSKDVRRGLAWYREGLSAEGESISEPVAFIDRCIDHHACRQRVESQGKPWPLLSEVPA